MSPVAIQRVIDAGGLPVLAHPIRLGFRDPEAEEKFIGELRDAGLRGIEVFHSDHRPADMERYAGIARKYNLAVSGGSDFHGEVKPQISLGTGYNGNLNIPKSVLEACARLPDEKLRCGGGWRGRVRRLDRAAFAPHRDGRCAAGYIWRRATTGRAPAENRAFFA